MHSLRDNIASHGWLLYAVAFGFVWVGMPSSFFIGGIAAWLVMFGAAAQKANLPVAELEKIREVTARSMSQREVLAATFWICVAVSYNSTLICPVQSETARIVMDARLPPLAKWSCSTQGRAPNVFPMLFLSQLVGAGVSQVFNFAMLAPAFWYANKEKMYRWSRPRVVLLPLSDGDKFKMCLAIAATACFLATLPTIPVYKGGAYGSRPDQPRVGWMHSV